MAAFRRTLSLNWLPVPSKQRMMVRGGLTPDDGGLLSDGPGTGDLLEFTIVKGGCQ